MVSLKLGNTECIQTQCRVLRGIQLKSRFSNRDHDMYIIIIFNLFSLHKEYIMLHLEYKC